MAYHLPPWEIEEWPAVWVNRSLVMLEDVEATPELGKIARPDVDDGRTAPGAG